MVSNIGSPVSPGAPDALPSDAENDPPDADDEDAAASESESTEQTFLVFYQKKYYEVPDACVLLNDSKPLVVENGQAMGVLHECKSFPIWLKAGAGAQHMVLLEADVGGGNTQRGVYVTFKARGHGRSADTYILRALHKSIAKKYYNHFQTELTEQDRETYAELIAQEPPDIKQISPVSCHWRELPKEEEPQNVLYRRKPGKKKEDDEDDEPSSKGPAKKKAKVLPTNGPSDAEEEQDSEPQSTQSMAIVPRTPHTTHMTHAPIPPPAPNGVNFFAQTPGMITVDAALFEKMAAFYYTNGGAVQ